MARAPRLDPEVRRGLIVDAAERLLAEGDPLLVTFEQVAAEAGVSRALVHAYLGDRRGLIDAVQVRIVARLDAWVGHGLRRATEPRGALRAIVDGTFAFVEAEPDGWGVLLGSGGLDHPALHGVRARWAGALTSTDDRPNSAPHAVGEVASGAEFGVEVGAQAAVAGLLGGVGAWRARGVDPDLVVAALGRAVGLHVAGSTDARDPAHQPW